MEECDFKSKIRHHEATGCNLTSNSIAYHSKEKCFLYQVNNNIGTDTQEIIS